MRNTIDSVMKSIREFFAKLSRTERIRLGVLAVVIIALAIVVATVLSRVTYGTLYAGLDLAMAGEIAAELDARGVKYKTEGSTTATILVPEENVSELRMQLASLGYMSGGFTYDIFSQASGFGMTDLEKQSYLIFQDEYNTRQLLLNVAKIKDCLVKVKLPETSSFVLSQNTQTASAAVTVELISGATLSSSEVDAIASIVSAGTTVPLENVYIMDTNARLYTAGGDSTGSTNLAYQLELEEQVRTKLETQVVTLLSTVFGDGNVKAAVNVSLNFDKETVHSIEFAPPVEGSEEGIVVSMEELYEYSKDGTAGGVVGTDTNGIGTVQYPYLDGEGYDYYYIARTFNYEINQTVTDLEKAQATIKNLSIAVLVDSEAIEEDYTSNVKNLVVNAIGVGQNYVSVERLPFQNTGDLSSETTALENAMRAMKRAETIQLVIKGIIILLLVVAVLLFLRTLVSTLSRQRMTLAAAKLAAAAPGPAGIDYMAMGDLSESLYNDFDINSKSDGIEQLEKFIDKDSKAIAQLLRNWLTDEE